MNCVAPGGIIGIFGGGQLGRMLALAAAPLGYRCHIYCPEADSPAALVAAETTVAAYDDQSALHAFADAVDVASYEFENIPIEAVETIAPKCPIYPGPLALKTAQDRLDEKTFIQSLGIGTAAFVAIDARSDLKSGLEDIGYPAVLKTRRLGYDGKGQALIKTAEDVDAAFNAMAGAPAILEAFVNFDREVSVVAARGQNGDVACYDLVENRHRNHILDTTTAPADVPEGVEERARMVAEEILRGLDYVGVIGVEMFLLEDESVLVNEIAPRVHNSGHWTIEGAATSQFEQHIRAIAGLPLGPSTRLFDAEMRNLIGGDVAAWQDVLAEDGAHLHLYGKTEIRPGRKMGHVTRIRPRKRP